MQHAANSKHRTGVERRDFSLESRTLTPGRTENWECESCVHPPSFEGAAWEVVPALGLARREGQFGAVAA